MVNFKDNFIERYSKLTEFNEFKEYCLKRLRKSIRVNTIKINVNELKKRLKSWKLEQIPWIKEGFFVNKIGTIGNLLEHDLGYIYVQEAASMIPADVLDAKEDDVVLDMAAAPGSKTTQIAAMMNNKGLLIANDYKYERLLPLGMNLQRCGVSNAIVTLMNAKHIKGIKFDKILLDAPCSGTGTIRKSIDTLKTYNLNMIKKLSYDQNKLILKAFDLLKEDGTLVYSTCSLEPEENEEVVDYLLENRNARLEDIKLNIKRSNPVLEFEGKNYNKDIKKCLRIWPQDNNTDGFFVAKIRRV